MLTRGPSTGLYFLHPAQSVGSFSSLLGVYPKHTYTRGSIAYALDAARCACRCHGLPRADCCPCCKASPSAATLVASSALWQHACCCCGPALCAPHGVLPKHSIASQCIQHTAALMANVHLGLPQMQCHSFLFTCSLLLAFASFKHKRMPGGDAVNCPPICNSIDPRRSMQRTSRGEKSAPWPGHDSCGCAAVHLAYRHICSPCKRDPASPGGDAFIIQVQVLVYYLYSLLCLCPEHMFSSGQWTVDSAVPITGPLQGVLQSAKSLARSAIASTTCSNTHCLCGSRASCLFSSPR